MKRRVVMMLAAAGMLAGCGMLGGGGPKETTVVMTLAAGNQLNLNAHQRPSPVVVRVFDLKTTAGFDASNYEGLFDHDRETLAAELVARDEFVLKPGEAKKLDRKLAPETKAIGIAVAFRELERAAWRTTVTVKPNVQNKINVNVDGVTVIATLVP